MDEVICSDWDSLSGTSKRLIEFFLDPVDNKPHPEIVIGNSEAFNWLWNHLGFLNRDSALALIQQTSRKELFTRLKEACIYSKKTPNVLLVNTCKILDSFLLSRTHLSGGNDKASRVLESFLQETIIPILPKELRSTLIKALSPLEGPWFSNLATLYDLTVEQINLLAENKNSHVRYELARTMFQPMRPSSPYTLVKLVGDPSPSVSNVILEYMYQFDSRFPCLFGFAIKLPKEKNWLAWPEIIVNPSPALPIYQIPDSLLENHPLLFQKETSAPSEDAFKFVTLEGTAVSWHLKSHDCPCHQKTFPEFPSIKTSYSFPIPEIKVSPRLSLELIYKNHNYQLWQDDSGKEMGWTSFPHDKIPITVQPNDWVKLSFPQKTFEIGFRKIIQDEISL